MTKEITIQSLDPNTFEFQTYSEVDTDLIVQSQLDTVFSNDTDYIEYYIYDQNQNLIFPSTTTQLLDYNVREGETPESIADKLYDDSQLHWVFMLVNDITDRYHDWPLNGAQFNQFVDEKYSNPDGIHHYEISQDSGDTSIVIDIGTDNTDYPTATPITNREYEESEHDRKRKIR